MSHIRDRNFWAIVGLVVLGAVAIALSVVAIATGRPGDSAPSAETATFEFSGDTGTPSETDTPSQTENTETAELPTDPEESSEPTVVVVGDAHSLGDPASIWLGPVSEQIGWGSVVNLSAPGRGYIATPRECENSPCAPFAGTVDAIAELEPDIVVTFGGVADGDVPLTAPATEYFSNLREALPDAQLVAISPVYSAETVPDWGPLHSASIRAGVEEAGGTFIDAGQPALGDGDVMSAESHAELAQTVVDNLQN